MVHEVTSVGALSSPAGAVEPALPGRRRSAPSGGSDDTSVRSVGVNIYSGAKPNTVPERVVAISVFPDNTGAAATGEPSVESRFNTEPSARDNKCRKPAESPIAIERPTTSGAPKLR